MNKLPCRKHRLAFSNRLAREAMPYNLIKCKKCGFFIEKVDTAPKVRSLIKQLAYKNLLKKARKKKSRIKIRLWK